MVFKGGKCPTHIEDEAMADLFEWDQTVVYEEEGQYIGRIV